MILSIPGFGEIGFAFLFFDVVGSWILFLQAKAFLAQDLGVSVLVKVWEGGFLDCMDSMACRRSLEE